MCGLRWSEYTRVQYCTVHTMYILYTQRSVQHGTRFPAARPVERRRRTRFRCCRVDSAIHSCASIVSPSLESEPIQQSPSARVVCGVRRVSYTTVQYSTTQHNNLQYSRMRSSRTVLYSTADWRRADLGLPRDALTLEPDATRRDPFDANRIAIYPYITAPARHCIGGAKLFSD